MFMEIDPYALLLLFFIVFAMGGVVGVYLGAWSQKRKKEDEEKWSKKYEEEHKGTPPPP
jgi:uncharacterized membrane protein YfcA